MPKKTSQINSEKPYNVFFYVSKLQFWQSHEALCISTPENQHPIKKNTQTNFKVGTIGVTFISLT